MKTINNHKINNHKINNQKINKINNQILLLFYILRVNDIILKTKFESFNVFVEVEDNTFESFPSSIINERKLYEILGVNKLKQCTTYLHKLPLK